MHTCIISFSSRADGNCAQLARLIESLSEDAARYDFSDFTLHPCGGCGYECFAARERCPHIGDMECRLLDAVTGSALTYFVIPNYCDYPCANFFIFNERSQCYFQGRPALLDAYARVPKRAVVVSNTNEANFREAMRYHGERVEMLFLSAKKYGKVSVRGDLAESGAAVADITEFVRRPIQ